MADSDCGYLPVVEDDSHVLAVVTDWGLTCRCVAEGKHQDTPVADVMALRPAAAVPATTGTRSRS